MRQGVQGTEAGRRPSGWARGCFQGLALAISQKTADSVQGHANLPVTCRDVPGDLQTVAPAAFLILTSSGTVRRTCCRRHESARFA